jgi:hypothetical protein
MATVPLYESSYADGAAVDAALDLAGTALQPADVGTAAAEDVGAFATADQANSLYGANLLIALAFGAR